MKPGLGLIGITLIFFQAALVSAQEEKTETEKTPQQTSSPESPRTPGKAVPQPGDSARRPSRGKPHLPLMMPPDDAFFSNFPEKDRERLKTLAKENPKQFRDEIRALFRAEREREMQTILRLRMRCLKETDPAKQLQLTEELKQQVAEKFDRHIKMAERHIAQNEKYLNSMQQRLERSKEDLARRKAAREQIIEKMLKNLLDPNADPMKMPPRPKPEPNREMEKN